MIILIEGSQGSGKSHMVNFLKKRCRLDKNIIFYKYQHVSHLKNLNIEEIEPNDSFHYFTVSNTLTILELHKTVLKDKIFVFDRGVFSAYAWSIMRKRLGSDALYNEISRLLVSDLYRDCHVIRVKSGKDSTRAHSDLFDRYADTVKEDFIFDTLFDKNMDLIDDSFKHNSYTEVSNEKDSLSEAIMWQTFNKLVYQNEYK